MDLNYIIFFWYFVNDDFMPMMPIICVGLPKCDGLQLMSFMIHYIA